MGQFQLFCCRLALPFPKGMQYLFAAIEERGGTNCPCPYSSFQLQTVIVRAATAVISAAFDTSFLENSPYCVPPIPLPVCPIPFSLWLSISNLAIFVALLWALINNCECHRLPSTVDSASCCARLGWCRGSSSTSYNVAALLPPDAKVGTNKVLLCSLPLSPLSLSRCILGLQFIFYICFQLQVGR